METNMPKITRAMGPSVAGVTENDVPSEAEYTAAMSRHGSGTFTETDAATVRAWLEHQARNFDPHAAPAEVGEAVADDASTKASAGPDAKGYADRVLEGAQTSAARVEAKADADFDVSALDDVETRTVPRGAATKASGSTTRTHR